MAAVSVKRSIGDFIWFSEMKSARTVYLVFIQQISSKLGRIFLCCLLYLVLVVIKINQLS